MSWGGRTCLSVEMPNKTIISRMSSIVTISTCRLPLSARVYWLTGIILVPVGSQLTTMLSGMLCTSLVSKIFCNNNNYTAGKSSGPCSAIWVPLRLTGPIRARNGFAQVLIRLIHPLYAFKSNSFLCFTTEWWLHWWVILTHVERTLVASSNCTVA